MRFDELPLYQAVFKVFNRVEKPGSDDWLRKYAHQAYKLVLIQIVDDEAWTDQGIPYSIDQVLEAWRSLRKQMKLRLVCELATKTAVCFYADRGVGECSEEINVDRIVPGSRCGPYLPWNCILTCSRHNQSRGDDSIEDFLLRRFDGVMPPAGE